MKIDRSSLHPTAPLRRKDKAGSTSDGGGFSDSLSSGGAGPAQDAGRAGGVAGPGSLLSLQEVPEATYEQERARQRGERLLDRLEELRDGLLAGRMAPDAVRRLADEVDHVRSQVSDPQLSEILDQIDLRAQVELAKLRR
jgi:hypothetical protein